MSDEFPCPKNPPWPDGCGGGCFICGGHGVITPEGVLAMAHRMEEAIERIAELDALVDLLRAETQEQIDCVQSNARTFAALVAEERARTAAERDLADRLGKELRRAVDEASVHYDDAFTALKAWKAARS